MPNIFHWRGPGRMWVTKKYVIDVNSDSIASLRVVDKFWELVRISKLEHA